MTEYCINKQVREWVLGKNVCDGDYSKCKYIIKFGKQEYCGFCPPRCSPHQIVKSQAGCIFCKHYTKDIDNLKCFYCLCSETRINFEENEP